MMKLRLFALAAVVLSMADAAGVARRMEEDGVYQPLDDTTLAQTGMEGASMSILDTAQAAGLNMFIAALSAAKLTDLFKTKGPLGPFTVFAPSDAAFEALGDDVKAMLFADPEGACVCAPSHDPTLPHLTPTLPPPRSRLTACTL